MSPPGRSLLLRGGRVIDPASGRDERTDVLVSGSRVEAVAPGLAARDEGEVLDVGGWLVTPGLVDPHVHFREPGQEHKETIATGAAAAAAGGYTTVCAMPNTDPVIDSPAAVRSVLDRSGAAGAARVRPIAAATEGSAGERATDAAALADAGAVALSDDGLPIATAELLAEVLERAEESGLVVADHCEDRSLSEGGAVFETLAERLGVGGIPADAESVAVERDLEVLERIGGRLHLCHLSTARSIELVRRAKADGLPVTAEVTPHHLVLTARAVELAGADAKMNPPLATDEDREAVRSALGDGTADCVATDHAPHAASEKDGGLEAAPFGIVGLETAFGLLHTELVLPGELSLEVLIERMTVGPARAFGLEAGRLEPGAPADVAVFALEEEWTVDPTRFLSRSRNTPFAGWPLVGRPVVTVVGGRIVHDARRGTGPQ
ncbi:MAG: dihydroorotase [Gemmatimonadota bacterium]|nr:dihydroorotase [Gemmatimonadota bacterium]